MSKRRGTQHRRRPRPGRVTFVQVGSHLVCEHIAQDPAALCWIEANCTDPYHRHDAA